MEADDDFAPGMPSSFLMGSQDANNPAPQPTQHIQHNDPTAHFAWVNRGDAVEETDECPACRTQVALHEIVYLACGHPWCSDCLNNNIRAALSERKNYPPRCCDSTPSGIDLLDIQSHLEIDVVSRLAEVREEFSSDDPTFCFNPACGEFIPVVPVSESKRGQATQWATCQRCQNVTCIECKKDRKLHPSPDQHPDLMSKEDKELCEKQGWKQCPNSRCRKMIERIDGCDHMRCHCGTRFCYQCGRQLDHGTTVAGLACNCRGQNPWLVGIQQWQNGGGIQQREHAGRIEQPQNGWNRDNDAVRLANERMENEIEEDDDSSDDTYLPDAEDLVR